MPSSPEMEEDPPALRELFDDAGKIGRVVVDQMRARLSALLFGNETEPVRLGRFQVLDRLGAGGMGVVYSAIDPERHEQVAIKTLTRLDPQGLNYLKREFRALAEVSHPNLVELYELFTVDGTTFFSMELIDGRDLVEHLRGASEAAIVAVFRQVANAVVALHRANKLHRDIKPSNVLVTAEGRAVLIDFGLVHDVGGRPGGSTATALAAGTPLFMSPEQAAGEPLSTPSDWYSFGAMLYRVLAGCTPFAELDLDALMREKRTREPLPPRHFSPAIDPELDSLCVALLRREPAQRPEAAEILRRLADERVPDPQPRAAFVGRDAELARLEEAFGDVQRSGRPVIIHISGEPGVGKTSLVGRFLDRLTARSNPVVLVGRCYQQESVPYPGFDSLIDALVHKLVQLSAIETAAILPRDAYALGQLFPVMLRVRAIADAPRPATGIRDAHESRRRAFAALADLLARLADRRGALIVFLDDLQWGDSDTARLLGDLARAPAPPQMLLIASHRHADVATHAVLAELAVVQQEGADVRDVVVAPLSRDEAQCLAAELLGNLDVAAAHYLAKESDGNPLLLGELVRFATAGGEHPVAPDPSVSNVLGARVDVLPEDAQRLLEVVAIAGVPIEVTVACEAAQLRGRDRRATGRLVQMRLISVRRSDGVEQLECFHDRVRETVVARLDADEFAARHRCVAEALESHRLGAPAELAMHFRAAGQSARALHYLVLAARRAADALAFDRAAATYRLALELAERTSEIRRDLQRDLGEALANAGRGREAADAYLAATDGADTRLSLELRRLASDQLLRSGYIEQGRALTDEVLRSYGMSLPRSATGAAAQFVLEQARLHLRGFSPRPRTGKADAALLATIDACWSAMLGLVLVDPASSWAFIPRHLRLALDAGEPIRIARGVCMYGWLLSAKDPSAPRTSEMIRLARSMADQLGDPYVSALVELVESQGAMYHGRWDETLEHAEAALVPLRAQCTGSSWEINQMLATMATAMLWKGQIKRVMESLRQELRSAQERGDRCATVLRRGNRLMSFGWLADDDPERAMREIEMAKQEWPDDPRTIQHQLYCQAEVTVLLYTDPPKAWRTMLAHWPGRKTILKRAAYLRIWAWSLRGVSAVAAAVDETLRVDALADAELCARTLLHERSAFGPALGDTLLAGIAARRGDRQDAARRLELSAARLDTVEMTLWAACARRRLGQLRGGSRGADLIAEADTVLAGQDVRNPERFCGLFVPRCD